MNLDRELEMTRRVVASTCSLLSARWGREESVLASRGREIKTKIDQEAEQLILKELQSHFDYPIVSEESGITPKRGETEVCWIVDPLDGTMNFVRRIPFFAVSVGLWKGEEPLMGVIGEIHSGSLYEGVLVGSVRQGQEAIRVSKVTRLDEAVVATGFPVQGNFETEFLHEFASFWRGAKKIRMFGCAALSLAYVASGRVDAYLEEGIMLWDIAAGVAIVKAAGGSVLVKKNPRHLWARDVYAAANDSLLEELLQARDAALAQRRS